MKGIHNIKMGVNYSDTILTENDSFGIVDPTANAVCLNADGSPDLNPSLTNPAGCTGALQAESELHSASGLLRPDPNGAAAGLRRLPEFNQRPYIFNGHADIREEAVYVQDTINKNNWTFNLGLRGDFYHGITSASKPSLAWASLTESSPPAPCCASPTPAPWKRRSMRTWSLQAWGATIP